MTQNKALLVLALLVVSLPLTVQPQSIQVDWDKTLIVSKSTPTLQVVVNPMLRRGSPIHDQSFAALKALGAEYVRYVPWLPYPRLAVAELEKGKWDLSLIDPMTTDFLSATEGHSTIINFSTIPAWLFKTDKPITYPDDPDQVTWDYTQGTQLNDPSGKELGDYYARLVSWYTNGGFTDENGKEHHSGHHYSFPYWEVLNEPDFEHHTTPQQYTERYDAIVSAIHQVSPQTKFVGLALAMADRPDMYEYFLNHANHKPGVPLDFISYHFYASPTDGHDPNVWQYSFFDQADRFLAEVKFIEAIRKRLSPETKTDIDELGVILPGDGEENAQRKALPFTTPEIYWNAAGALYAYLFIGLTNQGIDVIGESQLVGYPSQFPSVSMMDWRTGKPNARYWVLKLIKDNFHPGDKLTETHISHDQQEIAAQAFLTPQGRKLLLINKRNRAAQITLPAEAAAATLSTVNESTGDGPPQISQVSGTTITLAPYAVTVVSWPLR
jgi:hypothetical protein